MNTLLLKIIENIVEELENKQDKTIQDIELINELSNIALKIIDN